MKKNTIKTASTEYTCMECFTPIKCNERYFLSRTGLRFHASTAKCRLTNQSSGAKKRAYEAKVKEYQRKKDEK